MTRFEKEIQDYTTSDLELILLTQKHLYTAEEFAIIEKELQARVSGTSDSADVFEEYNEYTEEETDAKKESSKEASDENSPPVFKPFITSQTLAKLFNIIGMLSGLASMIFGYNLSDYGVGHSEEAIKYGGDAYTGIQNATAQVADNLVALSRITRFGFSALLCVFGVAIICYFACRLCKSSTEH